jgi:DnaJ family protein C protein 2
LKKLSFSSLLPWAKFYKAWNPVFVAEGRFSNKQPVPTLGDEDSTQEHDEWGREADR